jgi:FixJ family two-component response regulator
MANIMPRLCKLCSYPDQAAVNEALVSGATHRAIGREFGMTHVSVGRHRREHVVKPMQAATAALDKGRAVRERRDQLVQQAAQGDPTAIFRLDSIAADIARIAARLSAS